MARWNSSLSPEGYSARPVGGSRSSAVSSQWVHASFFQLGVAETNGQRIVAACEEYHAANGRFPENLDELVPKYMNSVPVAKYCLGPWSKFIYVSRTPGDAMLFWHIVPPHYRKIYRFETRSWSYLD
jgi:hypothetical protein